jgi:antitoxin VapB
MESAKLFTINKSQAVRFPKAVALPSSVKEVRIIPLGRGRLVLPKEELWASWFEEGQVSEGFMIDREQPADQERGDV